MKRAANVKDLLANPVGRWDALGNMVGWCHSPSLCGVTAWGKPSPEDVPPALLLLDGFLHPAMTPPIRLVLDGTAMQVDLEALELLFKWLMAHRQALKQRVELQVGIVGGGPTALLLTGILPLLGDFHPFKVFSDPRAGYLFASPEHGAAIHAEVQNMVAQVRRKTPELIALEALLKDHNGNLSLSQASRQLHLSSRSLQRQLGTAATTYREVQAQCRYECAIELLVGTRMKVSAVAARVGVSDRALAALFQAKAGRTPSELRQQAQPANDV